jgi:hypothetical protein
VLQRQGTSGASSRDKAKWGIECVAALILNLCMNWSVFRFRPRPSDLPARCSATH